MEPRKFEVQMFMIVEVEADNEGEAIDIAREQHPDLEVDDVWEIGQ